MASLEEIIAQQKLAEAGSVMARGQQPDWRRNLPQTLGPTVGTAAQAGLSLLDLLAALGPSPVDAFGGKAADLAGKASLAQLLFGGGSGPGSMEAALRGYIPGSFRALGLQRTHGDIVPEQYAMMAQQLPGYDRFIELARNMVRKSLGEEFPVYRGFKQTERLARRPAQEGTFPITSFSLDPSIGQQWAQTYAEASRKPAHLLKGKATPDSVMGLLPKRDTHGHEEELVIDPLKMKALQLTARVNPARGSEPVSVGRPDPILQAIFQAVHSGQRPPTAAEALMQVLQEAEQPPVR